MTSEQAVTIDKHNLRLAIWELRRQAKRSRQMADTAVTKAVADLLRRTTRQCEEQAAYLEAKLGS